MDIISEMIRLSRKGYFCSQILLILALEFDERESPELIRAMGGLNGGLGSSGKVCGALTGGACYISYFAGKGEDDEIPHDDCDIMINELCDWFYEYTSEYGGCNCDDILAGDNKNKIQRCPYVTEAVYNKCMEILDKHEAI